MYSECVLLFGIRRWFWLKNAMRLSSPNSLSAEVAALRRLLALGVVQGQLRVGKPNLSRCNWGQATQVPGR